MSTIRNIFLVCGLHHFPPFLGRNTPPLYPTLSAYLLKSMAAEHRRRCGNDRERLETPWVDVTRTISSPNPNALRDDNMTLSMTINDGLDLNELFNDLKREMGVFTSEFEAERTIVEQDAKLESFYR
jgi:hypothetical protein